MILKVHLSLTEHERINVPVLYIKYRERTSEFIKNKNSLSDINIQTEYRMSMKSFRESYNWGFIVALIATVLLCGL